MTANAGLDQNSVACAVNIIAPEAATIAKPVKVHGSRWRASPRTGNARDSPRMRRSNIAIEPTSSAMPVMWTISTIGYNHSHCRIAAAKAVDSGQTSAAGPAISCISAVRPSCRRR
ncbi:MAG: hypothetical protein BroJett031_03240 [Betaproteobacteria bacterium]|nr:MAG: hypothetical protein BroJett031_03240 [Betaproteobacteria bacterium]